jgi:hypothetical protein
VAVTGEGGLVDVRFEVLNGRVAQAHAGHAPLVVDEATGTTINEPYMDHGGHDFTPPAQGGGFLVLRNSAGLLARGGLVSVVLGDHKLEHVVAQ